MKREREAPDPRPRPAHPGRRALASWEAPLKRENPKKLPRRELPGVNHLCTTKYIASQTACQIEFSGMRGGVLSQIPMTRNGLRMGGRMTGEDGTARACPETAEGSASGHPGSKAVCGAQGARLLTRAVLWHIGFPTRPKPVALPRAKNLAFPATRL